MKTQIVKFVMPILVFIMAIGLAFATGTKDNARLGYYKDSTGQVKSIMVDCENTSSETCEFEEHTVYADPGLNTPLRKTL